MTIDDLQAAVDGLNRYGCQCDACKTGRIVKTALGGGKLKALIEAADRGARQGQACSWCGAFSSSQWCHACTWRMSEMPGLNLWMMNISTALAAIMEEPK